MTSELANRTSPSRSRAMRATDESLALKRAAYEEEIRALIQAGFALVGETGQLEPKVGAIVSKAGLSNKAFYRHFSSKDEFLLAMLEDGIALLKSYLEHRIEASKSPLARIQNFIEGVIAQALDPESATKTRPFAISRIRLAESFPNEVRETEDRLIDLLAHEITEAQELGEIRHATPERDARLIYNLTMGWVERELTTPSLSAREDADHLITFALQGLKRP